MASSRTELQKHIFKRSFAKEQGMFDRTDLQVQVSWGPCKINRV